jgi:hypothetical protein
MTKEIYNQTLSSFLSPGAVGRELGISLSAVYNLIHTRDLRAIDVAPSTTTGRKPTYRIRREWLDDFLLGRTAARAPSPGGGRGGPKTARRSRHGVTIENHLGI